MRAADALALAKDLAGSTKEFIAKALDPISTRLEALERRDVRDGKDGRDGIDGAPGKDADPALVKALVVEAVAAIPLPKDGRDGIDGKDADPVVVKALVDEAVAALPAPRDGAIGPEGQAGPMGPTGPEGKQGPPGKDADGSALDAVKAEIDGLKTKVAAIDVFDRESLDDDIQEAVENQLALRPIPKDGRDGDRGPEGQPGRDGRDGLPGIQGEKGLDGKDGQHGRDGIDGKDGLGFDDIDVEYDGERGFTFKFIRGDQVKTFGVFTVPALIYRGVYQDAKSYSRGDTATWAGSTWHANTTTTAKPGTNSDWTLMVKRGNEGKAGPQGKQGEPGPRGEKGQGVR